MNGKMAVISDIHGNIWALDAVLDDIDRQGCDALIHLGDCLYGPLDPAATARRLMSLSRLVSIRGNQDRLLLETRADTASAGNPTLAKVLAALSGAVLTWLAAMPTERIVRERWFCCHGLPGDDALYLIEDVSSGRAVMRRPGELGAMLAPAGGMHVLCGHSHLPWALTFEGRLVVNPGSVGLPAYADDDPRHVMETGSPNARYAIIEEGERGPIVSLRSVPYDVERAVTAARANGREDWAACLQTGRALPGLP